eukprot:scaffold1049_cov168-Amphora_coffeaeformis.AAC.6
MQAIPLAYLFTWLRTQVPGIVLTSYSFRWRTLWKIIFLGGQLCLPRGRPFISGLAPERIERTSPKFQSCADTCLLGIVVAQDSIGSHTPLFGTKSVPAA